MQNNSSPLSTLLPLIIIFGLLLLRMRRMAGVRPMRLQSLWVLPAIFAALTGMLLVKSPPANSLQALILLAVLGVGALLGWYQGKLMTIHVDAGTGTLQVKASMWAMASFLAILLLRMGLRPWLTGTDSPVHAYVGLVTDGFLVFIVGFYGARAAEMFIRGRALLAAAAQTQSNPPG